MWNFLAIFTLLSFKGRHCQIDRSIGEHLLSGTGLNQYFYYVSVSKESVHWKAEQERKHFYASPLKLLSEKNLKIIRIIIILKLLPQKKNTH